MSDKFKVTVVLKSGHSMAIVLQVTDGSTQEALFNKLGESMCGKADYVILGNLLVARSEVTVVMIEPLEG